MDSAWLIGSAKNIDYDVIFTGDASTQSVSGNLYLWHPTDALSLLAQVAAAMTAASVPDAAVVLTKDRRVKLSSSGNFSVQWSDTGLRDLLGFTGNLAAASSYVAPRVSPLLWSPAKPLAPELSPIGTLGIRRPLAYTRQSPYDGSTFVVSHGTRIDQRFSAEHVDVERVFTPDELGGEFTRFFDDVLSKGYSFYMYREVEEIAGSTDAATLDDGLGPYVFTPSSRAPGWAYSRSRGKTYTDEFADIDIPCRVVPEYT